MEKELAALPDQGMLPRIHDAFTEHGGSLQWGQPRAGRAVTGKALGTAEAKA